MKDLLLVIDMQNAYLPGQPWACPSMPSALSQVQKLLDASACRNAYDAVFTRCIASEHPEGCWKQYNQKNACIKKDPFLNQIVPQLQPYLLEWPFYDKYTYSACSIPQLMERLSSYRQVLLAGVVAECCVLSTAEGLIDAGVHVLYLKDAVAGQDGAFEQMVCRLMERFVPVHTQVATARDYLSSLHF